MTGPIDVTVYSNLDSARSPVLDSAPPVGGVVVLHVVESWGAGVRAATIRYAEATPEFEHHVLRGVGRSEFATDGEHVFTSVRELPSGALAARRAIRAAARELRPSIVHAQSSYAGFFVRTTLRTSATQRIVYSPHCFAFERRDLSPVVRAGVRAIETMLAGNTDTIAACSRAELATASRLGAKAVYVPNVPSTGSPAVVTSTEGVVAVGRLGAQKDPGFYSEVVERLRARRPAVSATWVGDGDDTDARAELEASGIRVTGWLSSAAAQFTVSGAAAYVHTAAWEGFPIAILEAVELGVPVVAREVPTLAGALATPGLTTPAAVAAAVDELLAGGSVAREQNLAHWRALLAENTASQQAAALRGLYSAPLAINGKWLGSRQSGMQRYAGEVARRILALQPAARVIAPANAVLPGWLPEARVTRSRLSGVAFEQLELPWRSRGSTLLNLAGAAPLARRDQLVVMHDATPARFPQTFSRRFVAWYSVMNRVLSRRARYLATVSEFSRGELADVLGVDRFTVAGNGHEHVLVSSPALLKEDAGAFREEYVLCIGNLTPNKNLVPVATALAAAGIRVVVVGAGGASNVYAQQAGLDIPGVELVGRVSDDELASLLRGAKALVFPSLYEGFGLPVVEAQALGCPVIASDAASIPEVAGDGALYFNPLHPEQAVALVQSLDADTRRGLVERGHANVARHTWDATAMTLLEVISR